MAVGVMTAGLTTAGLTTAGLTTAGLMAAGLMTAGLMTAGLMAAGLTTAGLMAAFSRPERAVEVIASTAGTRVNPYLFHIFHALLSVSARRTSGLSSSSFHLQSTTNN
jgi:hypothetical protein